VPIDGVRETPDVNHPVATNGTLPEDFRVEYYRFGSDSYVYRFEQWNQSEVVSVEADSSTGDGPFAVDYLGVVELVNRAGEQTSCWLVRTFESFNALCNADHVELAECRRSRRNAGQRPSSAVGRGYSVPRNRRFLVCERDAKRLVNAVIICSYTILLQAHRPT
jgi:hypothetical protein